MFIIIIIYIKKINAMLGIKLITFFSTPSSKRYPPPLFLQDCQGLHKDCWKEALSTYYNLAGTTKMESNKQTKYFYQLLIGGPNL
jgi:hypothetical protein